MDSFEFNKVAGAILATVLFTAGMSQFAGAVFSPKSPTTPGWALPAETETKGAAPGAPVVPLPELLATADVKKGETAAKECLNCHSLEKGLPGKSAPPLFGILGRQVASVGTFAYSTPMKEFATKTKTWSYEDLDKFLANPKTTVRGTSMTFGGLGSATRRADIILFLRSKADAPVDLPK